MAQSSILARARLLFAVLGLLAVSMGVGGMYMATQVRATIAQITSHQDRLQELVLEFKINVIQVQQWLTDISATRGRDGLNDGFTQAEEYFTAARANIRELAELDANLSATTLTTALTDYYETGKKMAQLYIDRGPEGGNAFMSTFDAAAAAMGEKLETLMTRTETEKVAAHQQLEQQLTWGVYASLIATLLLIAGLISGLIVLARLLQPLVNLQQLALRMAGNDFRGNDGVIHGAGEIAVLSQAFQQLQTSLSAVFSRIANNVQQMYDVTRQLQNIASATLQNARREQHEIAQVATSISQMTSTVGEIARNSAVVSEAAAAAQRDVTSSQKVVQSAVGSINGLTNDVMRGADSMARLETDSERIGSVLDVIRGIAEQTNLLALNAAIEAARAGEQGRGFAVVADEVRALASRTQQSTREIQNMIEQIQHGSRDVADAMRQGREQAVLTISHTEQVDKALQEINAAVSTISGLTTQIATAAEQQGYVSNEINHSTHRMRESVDETSNGVNDTTQACSQLLTLVEAFHQEMATFQFR